MEIRKFIFTIMSRFDNRGVKAADAAARQLGKTVDKTTKHVGGLTREHKKSGDSAEKAAAKSAKAVQKTERGFFKALKTAERTLDKQDAARSRDAAKAAKTAERKASAEARAAARASAAVRREAEKATRAKTRELNKLALAEKRANEQALTAHKRVNDLIIKNDLRNYKQRRQIAAKAAQAAEADSAAGSASRRQALSDVGGLASSVGRAVGIGVVGLVGMGTAVLQTGASFESLRARLKTVEGSAESANAAFAMIQDFAKKTPFEIDNLTEGFTQLRVRGVKPTTDTLTGLGDLTSAFGLQFTDVTEAIGAAARGELDPIEKFGISAKIAGDKIRLSFKGQVEEVDRSAEAVTNALVKFGKMEGVQGAMAEQAATAAGIISNLKDGISTFFDEISQLGALEEFKGLLGDLADIGGGEGGLAQVVSDLLVTGLKSLRETIQAVTMEDIKGFLMAAQDAVGLLADALKFVVESLRWFNDQVGDTEKTITLLTLGVFALTAAFSGPAGLAAAAGAVGVALGMMAADAILSLQGFDEKVAETDARIKLLKKSIFETEARIDASNAKIEGSKKKLKDQREAIAKQQKAQVEQSVGGLGAGLLKEDSVAEQSFSINQIRGGAESEKGYRKLFTAEGRAVHDAVVKAEKKRVADAEKTARREARKRGGDEEKAAAASRAAVTASNEADRKAAFEVATQVFAKTGSAEAAAAAAVKKGEPKGAKKKKGGAGATFFDFEKEAGSAAKSQGETFAQQELERLASEGIVGKEAIAMAQAAGKKRAAELKEQFIAAGKVFDTSANSILDTLGLKGPGSVLEGRPPPQTLLITISPVFKMIETFHQTIGSIAGAKELAEVTGEAGKAAAEAGLDDGFAKFEKMFDAMIRLQADRLLKAEGGGSLPMGATG